MPSRDPGRRAVVAHADGDVAQLVAGDPAQERLPGAAPSWACSSIRVEATWPCSSSAYVGKVSAPRWSSRPAGHVGEGREHARVLHVVDDDASGPAERQRAGRAASMPLRTAAVTVAADAWVRRSKMPSTPGRLAHVIAVRSQGAGSPAEERLPRGRAVRDDRGPAVR